MEKSLLFLLSHILTKCSRRPFFCRAEPLKGYPVHIHNNYHLLLSTSLPVEGLGQEFLSISQGSQSLCSFYLKCQRELKLITSCFVVIKGNVVIFRSPQRVRWFEDLFSVSEGCSAMLVTDRLCSVYYSVAGSPQTSMCAVVAHVASSPRQMLGLLFYNAVYLFDVKVDLQNHSLEPFLLFELECIRPGWDAKR